MSFFGTGTGNTGKKKKQEIITLAIRQTVLERARYRCQKCSIKFSGSISPNFEHINGSIKDNRAGNLRALCSECFKEVEKKESKDRGIVKTFFSKLGTKI